MVAERVWGDKSLNDVDQGGGATMYANRENRTYDSCTEKLSFLRFFYS
jgi:hypothetical protein